MILTPFRFVLSKHCPDRTASLRGDHLKQEFDIMSISKIIAKVFDTSIATILVTLGGIVAGAVAFVGA